MKININECKKYLKKYENGFFNFEVFIQKYIPIISSLIMDKDIEDRLNNFGIKYLEEFDNGGILYCAGNGGFSGVLDHFVGELQGLVFSNRKYSLPAFSLTSSPSTITAISNDLSFDDIFYFQLKGILKFNDSCILASTSGNSKNIVKTLEFLNKNKINTLFFTGEIGNFNLIAKFKNINFIKIPVFFSKENVPYIQDITSILLHYLALFIDLNFHRICKSREKENGGRKE